MSDADLSPEETLVTQQHTHPKVLAGPTLIGILCIAAAVAATLYIPDLDAPDWALLAAIGIIILAFIIWVAIPIWRWRTTVYTITTDRIMAQRGILSRRSREIPIHRITQVSCQQGILDRIFGAGTLLLADAASMEGGTRFKDIPQVKTVQESLNDLIYRHRTNQQASN